MAGRAGRRGLDTTGTVIILASDELPEQTTLSTMILGKPGKLQSQFRLTYNMILNLLRVEALKVEEMIKRSFSENASQRLLPDQQKKVIESEKTLSSLPKLECDICLEDIHKYYDTSADLVDLNQRIISMAASHPHGSKSLMAGRVVVLRDGHFRWNVAVLLKPAPTIEKIKSYFVLALVSQETKERKNGRTNLLANLLSARSHLLFQDIDPQTVPPHWPPKAQSLFVSNGVYELLAVPITSISLVQVDPIVELHKIVPMKEVIANLAEIVNEWVALGTVPEVDWSRIRVLEFQELLRARDQSARRLDSSACTLCEDFEHHYTVLHAEKVLRANIANLKMAISDQNLELIPDYEQRIDVLKELKFIDQYSTVQLKGRVACEINSVNELVLTELILENTLAAYEPEEVVALLSSFVFQEKTEIEPLIPSKLEEGREAILAISDRVGRVQDRNKVAADDFRSALKFGLMEVVYEWAKGMPFEQITSLTDVAEGTIVRVITRLDETCREVRDAARVIGDADLMKKMEEAQIKIKRDNLESCVVLVAMDYSMLQDLEVIAVAQKHVVQEAESTAPISIDASDAASSVLDNFEPLDRDPKRIRVDLPSVQNDALKNLEAYPTPQLACGPPQRRRVNPESLAARLGPELVAELEKHITPGNIEMPPFSVRRDIQVKFGIDRRHIYDFFHSRGLRCLKEEKGGRKDIAISQEQSRFRPVRQLATPPSPKMPAARKRRAAATSAAASLSKPTQTRAPRKMKALPQRAKIVLSSDTIPSKPHIPYDSPNSSFIEITPEDMQVNFMPVANPLDETFSLERALGDLSYAYRSRPVFERMVELQELSSGASTPALTPSTSSSSPPYFSSQFLSSSPASLLIPDPAAEQAKSIHAPVNQADREDHYEWISTVLGPAVGVQENVGTYKSYMEHQRHIYFERILSDDRSRPLRPRNTHSTGDFRSWVLRARSDPTSHMLPSMTRSQLTSPASPPVITIGNVPVKTSEDDLDALFPDLQLEYPDDCSEPGPFANSFVVQSMSPSLHDVVDMPRVSADKQVPTSILDSHARCLSGLVSGHCGKNVTASSLRVDHDNLRRYHSLILNTTSASAAYVRPSTHILVTSEYPHNKELRLSALDPSSQLFLYFPVQADVPNENLMSVPITQDEDAILARYQSFFTSPRAFSPSTALLVLFGSIDFCSVRGPILDSSYCNNLHDCPSFGFFLQARHQR
ncbi:hypothetical protein EWM64_g6533 [Hericium alpestre]|uniref:ATP-dependent RNA helicase Ski2/MTR4 C-terminal domain-containing protein n=1 Tax=Hericium alpestre TaxID=135208 RepID=A0A4Y9ZVE2_9AGAM|nr:hypothetical protein EWM64_g6533 [Hericium alpestre]